MNAGKGKFSPAATYGPVFFLAAIFFCNFSARISLGPLMPAVERELGLGHAWAGSLFLCITVGYFISILGSGFVSARLGHRRTIVLAACGIGLVLGLVQFASAPLGLALGLFCLGLCAGLYLPSGVATLTELVAQPHWGRAFSIHELAPNLSFVAAPLVAEALIDPLGWRGVMGALGAASLLLGLAYARRGRGSDSPGQPPSPANLKKVLVQPSFWVLMGLFSLGVGASLGVFTMLPLYLVSEHDLARSQANLLVAASRVAGVAASFLAGWTSDRLGPRRTLAGVFAASGLLTILMGLSSGAWLWLAIFLQPTVAVCFFPAAFAALSRLSEPASRNLVVSLCVPLGFVVGGGGFPAAIGWAGQHLGFSWGIAGAGVLILGGLTFLPWLDSKE